MLNGQMVVSSPYSYRGQNLDEIQFTFMRKLDFCFCEMNGYGITTPFRYKGRL